ncbi:sodium:proline symporter, partial [Xanthomonas citri pv. citri]|nr:sodium:proline symporter [Xanthomonas citri pv. citri]
MPPSQDAASLTQLGVIGVILLVVLFYAGTMIMSVAISQKRENADAYMTAGNQIGFGVS